MQAFLFIAGKRQAREEKRLLRLHAQAARGDPKAIQRTLREADE